MRTVDVRLLVAALAVVGLVGTCDDGGGNGGLEELRGFAPMFARAACPRVYNCCTDADRAATRHLDYVDQAACLATMEEGIRRLEAPIQMGLGQFDPEAGRRCLASLEAGACSALFDRAAGFVACRHLLRGNGGPGAPCDNTDILCASGWCHRDVCAVRPACIRREDCGTGQFCDAATDSSSFTCLPARARGEPCRNLEDECGAGARCLESRCVDRLADGERCQVPFHCGGICTNILAGTAEGTCRPALCQGSPP